MKKYLIEYQLEDEAPTYCVMSSKNEDEIPPILREKVFAEHMDYGLTNEEAQQVADNLFILSVEEV